MRSGILDLFNPVILQYIKTIFIQPSLVTLRFYALCLLCITAMLNITRLIQHWHEGAGVRMCKNVNTAIIGCV